jgi:TonB family protein
MNQHHPDPEPPGAASSAETNPPQRGDLPRWLIRGAARAAPPALGERLQEEWLADLSVRHSALARLGFALGCCWATVVIGREYGAAATAAAAAGGQAVVLPGPPGDSGFPTRNSVTVIAVLAFHLIIFYALLVGLGVRKITEILPGPFKYVDVHERIRPPPVPEMPRVKFTDTDVTVEIPKDLEPPPVQSEDDRVDPVRTELPPGRPTGTSPLHEVNRTTGGPGTGFPNAEDFYPSPSRMREEQGIATVRVCVDPRGRLTAAPSTVQSSGYPRLDAAALQLARAGSGHYRASTEDGVPVDACYAFRVRFELRR